MSRILISLLLATLMAAPSAQAQYREKLDFQLKAYLQMPHADGEQVDLFIHGGREAVGAAVRAHGGTVKNSLSRLVAARVPVDRVRDLAADPAVEFFEFSLEQGRVLNDSMRVKNHVNEVHAGLPPLPAAYDGEGVIMGIIDSGLDWNHPDFQDADGNTRILKYWDQTLPVNGQTPQPWNYGQVWTQAQIDAGQMTSVDQPAYNGHGSTVAGTAAGNGLANGRHKGVAPKADLIIVSASFGGNFRGKVADAVQYIFQEAAALGRPVVINASLGSYTGSHDGLDAAALLIDDQLLAQPGRAMVCAAGNTGNLAQYAPYHLRTDVGADTTFTWFRYNANSALGYGAVFFEVWADIADLENVQYAIGADRVSPSLQYRGRTNYRTVAQNLGQVLSEPLVSTDGNTLANVETYLVQRGGQYLLQVHLQTPDSNAYNFRFMTTGSGKFDVWSSSVLGTSNMVNSIPSVAAYPAIANYVLPDNDKHMVDSWACSDLVLTVANYQNETTYVDYYGNTQTVPGTENAIALASSKGPTRDDRQKPDVAATGDITFSAAPLSIIASFIAGTGDKLDPGGMHIRNGGTSMASPVVAGTAALYLQKCPQATAAEVNAAIRSTAVADAFTGVVPNNLWGHGKLDAFAALVTSNFPPVGLSIAGPPEFCEADGIVVNGPAGYDQYTWSNGATQEAITYYGTGPLWLTVANTSGCSAPSDTLTFNVLPSPASPVIDVQGGITLVSSVAEGYQWYLNGQPMDGETAQVHVAGSNGSYQVAAINAEGCSSLSEAVEVLITGIAEPADAGFALWPSPTHDVLHIALPASDNTFAMRVVDVGGRTVLERARMDGGQAVLDVRGFVPGTYIIHVQQDDRRFMARFVKLP